MSVDAAYEVNRAPYECSRITGVARHRVPPVRHLDARRGELAVRQRAEPGARSAQVQFVQGDARMAGCTPRRSASSPAGAAATSNQVA